MYLFKVNKSMLNSKKISKLPSDKPSLDFEQLREEGVGHIQELSGKLWTDYNLHDPGITTLEVLCYALTELGFRADLLRESFESEETAVLDSADSYFFNQSDLIPSLPLTRRDFELFIEKNHDKVLSAWFKDYSLLHSAGPIHGGYEIVLMLEPDNKYGNLNTDVIQITAREIDALFEVNFFDEENNRMKWKNIKDVTSCMLDDEDPDAFFEFEDFNCQVAIILEVIYRHQSGSQKIRAKARVTLNPRKKRQSKTPNIGSYKKAIINHLESPEFLEVITENLSKERYKARLLTDIQQTLLPYRNLCEDFISLRVANEQEVKIDVEIILDDNALPASGIINRVFDQLDAFLMQLLLRAKQPENRAQKNVLYASNIIKEVVKIEGIKAARIVHLNLFIDGIPTIPVKDETSFECIHLQRFSHYVPKISREKSSVTFIRSGAEEKVDATSIIREFNPQQYFPGSKSLAQVTARKPLKGKPDAIDKSFHEAVRQYNSIQYDFPKNYKLGEGQLSGNAPEKLKIEVKQFKAYLAFYERTLIDYLDRLANFNELLSVKQKLEPEEPELEKLKEELPDIDMLGSVSESTDDLFERLIKKNKVLDHLLARFSTQYHPIVSEELDLDRLERMTETKVQILRDIPLITRERGLGIAIKPDEKNIWDSDLLSGFQKRVYRLLGVKNEELRHIRLTKARSMVPVGFYLIEHILLANRQEDHVSIKRFNRDATVLLEFIRDLSIDNFQYEPYSYQLTVVLPDWYPIWRKRKNRVERVIKEELPAHILPYFIWLNRNDMSDFEIIYEDWLKSLLRVQARKSQY